MDFFGDLKHVSVSITIENNRGLVLTQNFPDVHQLAQFLKDNPLVAKKVGYVEKKKEQ